MHNISNQIALTCFCYNVHFSIRMLNHIKIHLKTIITKHVISVSFTLQINCLMSFTKKSVNMFLNEQTHHNFVITSPLACPIRVMQWLSQTNQSWLCDHIPSWTSYDSDAVIVTNKPVMTLWSHLPLHVLWQWCSDCHKQTSHDFVITYPLGRPIPAMQWWS